MKRLLTSLCTVTIAAGCITGCSTNTQNENTAVGALSGAAIGGLASGLLGGNTLAIGLSAVGGALIGGYVGHKMDYTDASTTNEAMKNDTNMPTTWTSKKTGIVYRVTPTSDMMTVKGNPNCRTYKATATVDGKTKTTHGTACRQPDGIWVITH